MTHTLLYVKRLTFIFILLMAAVIVFGALYVIIYVVSLGGGGPIR